MSLRRRSYACGRVHSSGIFNASYEYEQESVRRFLGIGLRTCGSADVHVNVWKRTYRCVSAGWGVVGTKFQWISSPPALTRSARRRNQRPLSSVGALRRYARHPGDRGNVFGEVGPVRLPDRAEAGRRTGGRRGDHLRGHRRGLASDRPPAGVAGAAARRRPCAGGQPLRRAARCCRPRLLRQKRRVARSFCRDQHASRDWE